MIYQHLRFPIGISSTFINYTYEKWQMLISHGYQTPLPSSMIMSHSRVPITLLPQLDTNFFMFKKNVINILIYDALISNLIH
jgi:hypothetical protein